eukprot:g4279.t1
MGNCGSRTYCGGAGDYDALQEDDDDAGAAAAAAYASSGWASADDIQLKQQPLVRLPPGTESLHGIRWANSHAAGGVLEAPSSSSAAATATATYEITNFEGIAILFVDCCRVPPSPTPGFGEIWQHDRYTIVRDAESVVVAMICSGQRLERGCLYYDTDPFSSCSLILGTQPTLDGAMPLIKHDGQNFYRWAAVKRSRRFLSSKVPELFLATSDGAGFRDRPSLGIQRHTTPTASISSFSLASPLASGSVVSVPALSHASQEDLMFVGRRDRPAFCATRAGASRMDGRGSKVIDGPGCKEGPGPGPRDDGLPIVEYRTSVRRGGGGTTDLGLLALACVALDRLELEENARNDYEPWHQVQFERKMEKRVDKAINDRFMPA